jgi:nitrogenase molybdenum-iron protein NifN
MDGFHGAVRAVVGGLAEKNGEEAAKANRVNVFPGMISPEDIRHLKDVFDAFNISYTMLPDYSDRLDGALWEQYQAIQKGGTEVKDIKRMGYAEASVEFGRILAEEKTSAARYLEETFGVERKSLGLPLGVRETDLFFQALEEISGRPTPPRFEAQRARLIDSFVDGHKYLSGVKAVVYGEEDLVAGIVSFLREIGVVPVLCASGGKSGLLEKTISRIVPEYESLGINIKKGVDFMDIEEEAQELSPDIFIGNSKGYTMARRAGKPLVRIGFPIHDRVGGGRIRCLGYPGAQELFDRIVNTLIEKRQDDSEIGYTYM